MMENGFNAALPVDAQIMRQTREPVYDNALAFCVDEAFLPFALFAVTQILEKEPDIPFDICLCVSDIDQVPAYFVAQPKLRFVQMAISGIEHLPTAHLSLATYHRLFLPQIFAADYRYIVYLDADIYINKPFTAAIEALVKQFPPQFCVAAAPDITEISRQSRKHGGVTSMIANYLQTYHQHHHIYRNAGILVFNVQAYIQQGMLSRIFTVMADNLDALRCHDQSALNLTLAGKMPILPFEINWQMHDLTYRLLGKRQPYILHFIGTNKPWVSRNPFVFPYYQEYRAFFRQHFPNRVLPVPKSAHDLRLEKPKHIDINKERISCQLARLVAPLGRVGKTLKFRLYRNRRIETVMNKLNAGHSDAFIDNGGGNSSI